MSITEKQRFDIQNKDLIESIRNFKLPFQIPDELIQEFNNLNPQDPENQDDRDLIVKMDLTESSGWESGSCYPYVNPIFWRIQMNIKVKDRFVRTILSNYVDNLEKYIEEKYFIQIRSQSQELISKYI